MTVTISLPRANYTARQYELFSTEGREEAAQRINGWIDREISERAARIAECKGDASEVGKVAREILRAVTTRIYEEQYETKYGATDSEPRWLMSKHIAKTVRIIAGLSEDEFGAYDNLY